MFFEGWYGLLRVLIVGTCAYAVLIMFLRISGKRTLAKFNAFDFVVTVALGSTLSSIIVSKSVALFEGLLALALLIVLQFAITWLSVRSRRFNRLIKAEPTLLFSNGHFLDSAMKAQRIAHDELLAAVRSQGAGDLSTVTAVILETDGSISVIQKATGVRSSLNNVVSRSHASRQTQLKRLASSWTMLRNSAQLFELPNADRRLPKLPSAMRHLGR